MNNIISFVPYRILPATSGGHGIADMHHYIGLHCHDNIIGTVDNADESKYSFKIHRLFPASPMRYIPRYKLQHIERIANEVHAKYIYCDHPYMALSAMELSHRLELPWFMRCHNIESERFRTLGKPWWRIMRWFEGYMMDHADGVFFVTPEDIEWSVKHYGLNPLRCHLAPYGTTLSQAPEGHDAAKQQMAEDLFIDGDVPWLYFLGALDYTPNIEALQYILNEILPRLEALGMKYQLLVAGKGLSEQLQQRIATTPNARYMGFIPVLEDFLKACDIMLNPVMTGGGIKTKVVEALGYNKMIVSSAIGAAGLIPGVCGNNLLVTADYDWNAFVQKIADAADMIPEIPKSFYDTYYWDNVAIKVLGVMKRTTAEFR